MDDMLILSAVFVAVLLVSFLAVDYVSNRNDMAARLRELDPTYGRSVGADERLEQFISPENESVRHYFDVIKKNDLNSVDFRLIRAGYFSTRAVRNFQFIRAAVAFVAFVAMFWLFKTFFINVPAVYVFVISLVVSAITFILANAVLDRMGTNRQVAYRRMFPEFMDMLIVCVDAGLSIEAAMNRVTREFTLTEPDFGTHLNIMMLEVRAGRRLRDALSNFAERVKVDEAKSLAILFRQSEELGSSVTKTLRVFSKEMRQMRMLRAEEKANSLPIKMLFPMALFLFPTNLLIVLVHFLREATTGFNL